MASCIQPVSEGSNTSSVAILQYLKLILRKEFRGWYREESYFDGLGVAWAVYAGSREFVLIFACPWRDP